jgi:two-component system, sensor histidine kinase
MCGHWEHDSMNAAPKSQRLVMAFCLRTSGHVPTDKGLQNEVSLPIARHQFNVFVNRFKGPATALSPRQHLLVRRRLLELLSRRVLYWMMLLLPGSAAMFVFGLWINTPGIGTRFRIVWIVGLWVIAAPIAIWLAQTTKTLPKDTDISAFERLHWAWIAFITLTSLWWASASFGLAPPPWIGGHGYHFYMARLPFLELTLVSHTFTLLLLAPSLRATLGSLVLGAVPFALSMGKILWINRPGMLAWFVIQLIGYCLLAFFLFHSLKRAYIKELVLVEARSQAEAATAEKNQFIAAISHDLRQPLTTLGLKLNYIFRSIDSTKLVGDLSVAQRQVDAMEDMINGALDICRLESGTWHVEIQEVALTSLLDGIATDARPLARAKGLKLKLHSRPYLIRTDRHALDRIVRNMVLNAIRYTPTEQRGKRGHILLSCQRRGEFVKISVWDNGIGIAADRQRDIFRSYVQVDNPERDREKGFGLGLSIVQGLAHLLDHPLSVNSAPDRGSRFTVTVPFVKRIQQRWPKTQTSQNDEVDLTNMVVVVIEDNSDLRIEISMRLIEHGCYVVAGESSLDVIEQLRIEGLVNGPHVILSDYRLRTEDGIAAIAAVRAVTDAELPAILWSGDTSSAVLIKVAASGLRLLAKPVSEATLLALLAQHKPKIPVQDA